MRRLAGKRIVLTLFLAFTVTVALALGATAATSAVELSSKGSGVGETTLGSLVADAIRSQVKAEVGFVTASELKDTVIPAGQVSAEDVARAITYRNDPVVVLTLRGEQVRRALERSVAIYPQKNLGFLQVSGLSFTFDPSKPRESRVVSKMVGAKPIEDSKQYSVAATNSLANGALGYFRVWGKDEIRSVTKTTVAQAADNYLKAQPKIEIAKGRITAAK